MSVRRMNLCSLRSSTRARALKSWISAATVTGQPCVSHWRIGPMPDPPSSSAAGGSAGPFPDAQTAPVPVMRTLDAATSSLTTAARGCGVDFTWMAQRHAAVGAAETEGVGQRHAQATLLRPPQDEIDVAVRIAIPQIRVDR